MIRINTLVLSLTLSAASLAEVPTQKDLVRITDKKIPMDPKLAQLCTGPDHIVGPHVSPTIHLYVNQAVIDYRKKNPDAVRYPIGAVFYKEKYDEADKATLATIMTKIADNNRADDWRYEMIELPSRKPVAKIDAASCRDCHERYEKQGFISNVSTKSLAEFLKKPFIAPSPPVKPKEK